MPTLIPQYALICTRCFHFKHCTHRVNMKTKPCQEARKEVTSWKYIEKGENDTLKRLPYNKVESLSNADM